MLNEIVYKYACMMTPSAARDLLYYAARENIGMMASEICASVPQFRTQTQSPRILASGHVLIWPLSILGASELVPVSLRRYAIESLRFIGTDMKIPQASHVAKALEQGKRPEDWSVEHRSLERRQRENNLTV
jgi:hypothetical protein